MAVLLKHHALVRCRDYDGDTPLHAAATRADTEAVRFLLENGHVSDASNNEANQPMHCAALTGCAPIIALLAQAGARVNSKNS
jgi:ankyrin repeat protein